MISSFVATTVDKEKELRNIGNNLFLKSYQIINNSCWSFLFLSNNDFEINSFFHVRDGNKCYLVGEIYNSFYLRQVASLYDSDALTVNEAGLALILNNYLGPKGLSLLEGCFTLLFINQDGSLMVVRDSLGMMPVNILDSNPIWISSEIKHLILNENLSFECKSFEEIANNHLKGDNFSPFKNIYKQKPGYFLYVSQDSLGNCCVENQSYHEFKLGCEQLLKSQQALKLIDAILNTSVENCITKNTNVAIALSGGLDSSLIASLASRKVSGSGSLYTYSIGTEAANEFKFSRLVAEHIGSQHTEIELSKNDILNGIIESIFYNEIFDGLSAEIQSGLFALYKKCSLQCATIMTGYGSDLLFGGILGVDTTHSTVNQILWQQVYRTRWTGELSPYGATHYGFSICHPFWNLRLIAFCLNLHPGLKISATEVKTILREYASSQGYLPEDIAWRKKIGIHEGSSINSIFAQLIGAEQDIKYRKKDQFTYKVYRELFEKRKKVDEIDIEEIKCIYAN